MELEKYSIGDLYNEIYSRKSNIVDLGKAKIAINPEGGGGVYHDLSIYKDFNDKLYESIYKTFNPQYVLDIGANIGLYSICFKLAFPLAQLLIFEPNPTLTQNIEDNLTLNGLIDYQIFNKAIGNEISTIDFQINEKFTVDSRCGGLENFKAIKIEQTTIDDIEVLQNCKDFVFIKIDVQGYEDRVLKGGLRFFKKSKKFLLKLEFAPFWLLSQQTNPTDFLKSLIANFDVVEYNPMGYSSTDFDYLLKHTLKTSDVESFVAYCENLNRNKMGHLDLL